MASKLRSAFRIDRSWRIDCGAPQARLPKATADCYSKQFELFRWPVEEERNGSRILRLLDCKSYQLGFTGVRFMIDRNDSNGRFSLVEHPMESRALAAPLHRHRNEDEYSFVIEG